VFWYDFICVLRRPVGLFTKHQDFKIFHCQVEQMLLSCLSAIIFSTLLSVLLKTRLYFRHYSLPKIVSVLNTKVEKLMEWIRVRVQSCKQYSARRVSEDLKDILPLSVNRKPWPRRSIFLIQKGFECRRNWWQSSVIFLSVDIFMDDLDQGSMIMAWETGYCGGF